MTTFGKLLQQYRKDAEMTQQALADKLKRTRTAISDWENDKYTPSERDEILRLEELLGLSEIQLDKLLQAAGKSLEYATSEAELAELKEYEVIRAKRVLADHLELTNAPTRPPEPIPTQIPAPRASNFVGRVDELEWLCQRLKAGDVAAVAGVRGIGGIGKTELAIAVVNQLKAHFGEAHIHWLECGPNTVPAIQDRLATALGVSLNGDDLRLRADSLALALRQHPPTLVVLDDIRRRHLAELEYLLPPRPPCALLVTSRRDDLPHLPWTAIKKLDVLQPAQSGDLLASLLQEVRVTPEPDKISDISKLLEHIPLALLLAARRAGQIARRRNADKTPLAALLDELRQRRRVLVLELGERPDLSIITTFQVSYEELNDDDQTRLRRLGVFARSEFELPALQAVWEVDAETARRTLVSLTNAGLLEEVDDETWWMHDLLREYAAEFLGRQDNAEIITAKLAHTAHWQSYLDNIELRSVAAWRSLEQHRPEVEHAAKWLLTNWQVKPELAVKLALSIAQTFQAYTISTWETWLTAGLTAAQASEQRNSTRRLQRSLGEYYQWQGQFNRAEAVLRDSLSTAQELLSTAVTDNEKDDGQRGVAVTQSSLAALLRTRGQYDEAERLYRLSLTVFEEIGDRRSVAVTQSSLAALLSNRGQYDEAERLYQSGLAISHEIRDLQGIGVFLMGLGQIALVKGQRGEAAAMFQEAQQRFLAIGLPNWAAQAAQLLQQAQGERQELTLEDVLAMVKAAQAGDQQAGQQVWQISQRIKQSDDATLAALGHAFEGILVGLPLDQATAALPAELRAQMLQALNG